MIFDQLFPRRKAEVAGQVRKRTHSGRSRWTTDWGYPIVDTRAVDDERLLHHARRAVATCPRLALLMEEFKAERRA